MWGLSHIFSHLESHSAALNFMHTVATNLFAGIFMGKQIQERSLKEIDFHSSKIFVAKMFKVVIQH